MPLQIEKLIINIHIPHATTYLQLVITMHCYKLPTK